MFVKRWWPRVGGLGPDAGFPNFQHKSPIFWGTKIPPPPEWVSRAPSGGACQPPVRAASGAEASWPREACQGSSAEGEEEVRYTGRVLRCTGEEVGPLTLYLPGDGQPQVVRVPVGALVEATRCCPRAPRQTSFSPNSFGHSKGLRVDASEMQRLRCVCGSK